MKIGLFDLYASGHHLPYANTIHEAVKQLTEFKVDFITLSATERQTEFFDPQDIVYLDPPESRKIEDRNKDFVELADEKISQLSSLVDSSEYDLIHFLYIDDILGPVQRHWSEMNQTESIGDLVGPFFTRGTLLRGKHTHPVTLKTLQSPLAPMLDSLVPNETSHEAMWRDLLLYRSLKHAVFDELILHSAEAKAYIDEFGFHQRSRHIPFPVQTEYRQQLSQEESRKQLGLPESETILLFFGTLRTDKGIEVLLDAVRRYSGPEFTLVIAGPPVSVGAEEIAEVDERTTVDIVSRLKFISSPGPYYRASDGVVMPYQREFGKENMSMIFQEACGSLRPIIAPNSGVLGRLTNEQNLGVTFEQGSAASLAAVIAEFIANNEPFSETQMREYAKRHSKEQTLSRVADVYREFDG